MIFSALLCITLHILMAHYTIYDDMPPGWNWSYRIGLDFMAAICLNKSQCQNPNWYYWYAYRVIAFWTTYKALVGFLSFCCRSYMTWVARLTITWATATLDFSFSYAAKKLGWCLDKKDDNRWYMDLFWYWIIEGEIMVWRHGYHTCAWSL